MRKGWLKHADHVPHPTNDNNMSQTMRFRHVLTMVLDGVRILELWGRKEVFAIEKVCLKSRSPKARAVALKRFCLAEKALPRTVALKTKPLKTNPQGHFVTKWKIFRFGMRFGMKSKGCRRGIGFRVSGF